jgi:hypothetical protein
MPLYYSRYWSKRMSKKTFILDLYACDSGVFHALEMFKYEDRIVKGKHGKRMPKTFYTSLAQVFDTISGNSVVTIRPAEVETKPLDEIRRHVPNEFEFVRSEDCLLYRLNGEEGSVFPCFKGEETEPSGSVACDGKIVYFNDRPIAKFDEDIKRLTEVDARTFSGTFRKKNRRRANKNRRFFDI